MDCRDAQKLLLETSEPHPDRCGSNRSEALAAHLRMCPACQASAAALEHLEENWRQLRLPARADRARIEFLRQHDSAAARLPAQTARRRFLPPRWAAAAVVLLAVSLGGWMLLRPDEVQASVDVVDRLVSWNLDLAQADSPEERQRLFADREPILAQEIQREGLPAEELRIAQALLDNGSFLADHLDPAAEVDRFSLLADKLLEQLTRAKANGNTKAMNRFARHYRRVAEQGIDVKLERLRTVKALDFDRRHKLERIIVRDAARRQALLALLDRAPAPTRKEIRRVLEVGGKPHKHKDRSLTGKPPRKGQKHPPKQDTAEKP